MNVSVGGKNTFELCMGDLTPECQERLKAFEGRHVRETARCEDP